MRIRVVDKIRIQLLIFPTRLMSALDTAKEIVRIGSTAGLSKDVIDLMEKKLSLLTEQVILLEKENSLLRLKLSHFETEKANLRAQLQNLQPVGFEENMGVLWKRTANGFEQHPYCKECASHPIMTPVHEARTWVCATGNHIAPFSVKPPASII
jgi:hypothetical protein